MAGTTRVFRTPDRTWRVEVLDDRLRAYWHGAHVGDCPTPAALDELMRTTTGGHAGLGDLIED